MHHTDTILLTSWIFSCILVLNGIVVGLFFFVSTIIIIIISILLGRSSLSSSHVLAKALSKQKDCQDKRNPSSKEQISNRRTRTGTKGNVPHTKAPQNHLHRGSRRLGHQRQSLSRQTGHGRRQKESKHSHADGELAATAVLFGGGIGDFVTAVRGEKDAHRAAQDDQRRRRQSVPARRFGRRLRHVDPGGILRQTARQVNASGKREPRA